MTLQWSNPEGKTVVLQQSTLATFADPVARYTGSEKSSVLSGLAEGRHYFRVGEEGTSNWSVPLTVEVKFFPRDRLFLLLGSGAVVVLLTMGTIIAGALRHRGEGRA